LILMGLKMMRQNCLAADMDRARSGKLGSEVQGHQAAYDLSDERAASQGRIPFLDWSQQVVDASTSMTGIEELGMSDETTSPDDVFGLPYDAWMNDVAPAEYAVSVDEAGVWDDDRDHEAGFFREMGIIPRGALGKLLRENMHDSPQTPWVYGPEGYVARPKLSQQYEKKQDVGPDSPPEVMVARALAYRASELTNYKKEFDDEIFSDYAMRIYQDYVMDKAGDKFEALDDMLGRIDDGGWDDDDIMDIAQGGEQYYSLSPEDPPGPLSESRLMHLAGLKED